MCRPLLFIEDLTSEAVTELARNADLLVTDITLFDERMKMHVASGQWQAMTLVEQERLRRRATRAYDAGRHRQDGGARKCENRGAVTLRGAGRRELHVMGRRSEKAFLWSGLHRPRLDGIIDNETKAHLGSKCESIGASIACLQHLSKRKSPGPLGTSHVGPKRTSLMRRRNWSRHHV